MNFKILDEKNLSDGSKRFIIDVDEAEKLYLGYFLESFENLCIYSSYKVQNKKVFYIDVPPDLINFTRKLFDFFKGWEL